MGRLLELFDKNKLTLIMSLPENSLEMAKAAIDAGADALKVHCNVKHKASGVSFGSLEEEGAKLAAILKSSKIPVGIVPGAERKPTVDEMKEIVKMGFDFVDMNICDMPDYFYAFNGITKVAALENESQLEKVMEKKKSNFKALEAAVVPHLGYGQNMTIGDLRAYITLAVSSGLPVIVPTQRKITYEEVPILSDTGIKALMIGAIVTGKTPALIASAVKDFRKAIDEL